ncbi:DUF4251 domain-containing protein [Kaistella sp.]|uniref:DUF4251 domain-containing protein n=1 Tax=Kaistella sp. TaxID=2782235 RepID=UPI002F935699
MKNLINILSSAFLLILINSCAATPNMPSEKVAALLRNGEFTFMAEQAQPSNYDVVNVMNSLPRSSSSRMLDLDYGYTIVLKKSELRVELPYFGRMYSPSYDTANNSYRFTSKDFTVSQQTGKKQSSVYTIITKDQPNIRRIIMEVFSSGKTYVSIDSNDRAPISYDGYLMENEAAKK